MNQMESLESASSSKTLLFVYGTLKSGYTNYKRYLHLAVTAGKAVLIGPAVTENKYPLVLRPLTRLPATRGPMLLNTHNSSQLDWCRIEGEVYEIDSDTLQAMDILEGVSSGFYYREHIAVDLLAGPDKLVWTHCYFYTVQEGDTDLLETGPLLSSYDDSAHSQYVAAPLDERILNCLNREP